MSIYKVMAMVFMLEKLGHNVGVDGTGPFCCSGGGGMNIARDDESVALGNVIAFLNAVIDNTLEGKAGGGIRSKDC